LIATNSTVEVDITIAGSDCEVVSLSRGAINRILKVQVSIPSAAEAEVSFKAHRVTIVLVTNSGNITIELGATTHVSSESSSIDSATKAANASTIDL